MKGLHPEGNNSFFLTNGCSSLNIHFRWGVQLFWAAIDMPVTVVPLKVAILLEKLIFGHLKKIIEKPHLTYTCVIIFLKCPKIKFVS